MEKLIKTWNNLINNDFDADREADSIMRYLMHKTTTNEAMQIFNRLEFKFMEEMQNREKLAARECNIVNKKYPKIVTVLTSTVHDSVFLKPIKEYKS